MVFRGSELQLRHEHVRTIFRDGKSVDMVSPIEGTVSDVNEAVVKDPSLALTDPFGEGWIVTVAGHVGGHRLHHLRPIRRAR